MKEKLCVHVSVSLRRKEPSKTTTGFNPGSSGFKWRRSNHFTTITAALTTGVEFAISLSKSIFMMIDNLKQNTAMRLIFFKTFISIVRTKIFYNLFRTSYLYSSQLLFFKAILYVFEIYGLMFFALTLLPWATQATHVVTFVRNIAFLYPKKRNGCSSMFQTLLKITFLLCLCTVFLLVLFYT